MHTEYPPAKAHDLPKMEMGECIGNSLLTALAHPELKYAEGLALSVLGLWYRHAWLVNAAGEAIDVTWTHTGQRYIGRTYQTSAVLAKAKKEKAHFFMDREAHPFVPEGEIGIDCWTERQFSWISDQLSKESA